MTDTNLPRSVTILGESPWKRSIKEALFVCIPSLFLGLTYVLLEYLNHDEIAPVALIIFIPLALFAVVVTCIVCIRAVRHTRGYRTLAQGLDNGDIVPDFHFKPNAVYTEWLVIDLNEKIIHINEHQWPLIQLRQINKYNSLRQDKYIDFTFSTKDCNRHRMPMDADHRSAEFSRLLRFFHTRCNWKTGNAPFLEKDCRISRGQDF